MTYITENQHRPDGVINRIDTARQTRASGLSYFYERKSKMLLNTEYTKVALMITDEDLSVIESCVVETQYTPPAEEGGAEE